MLTAVHPKLPMRNKEITKQFYVEQLGFQILSDDYPEYLMIKRDQIELHFFLFEDLDVLDNYGQIYVRTDAIEALYQELQDRGTSIHPNATLGLRPWGMLEFAIIDPDTNLITFGQFS